MRKHLSESHKKKIKETQIRMGLGPPSRLGKPHSEETKRKIREANTGKKASEELRKKLSEIHKALGHKPPSRSGATISEEHKQKLREANKGKVISESQRKQASERMKGTHLSEETKRKIGAKSASRKHSMEARGKISEALRKRTPSEKQLQALSQKGRKHSEASKNKMSKAQKGKRPGDKNPAWRGGISFEPYGLEFNEDLKKVIRNRDRRKCVVCEKTELEDGIVLAVHHIDYVKTNNNPNNLVSLCNSCHSKTNHRRESWTVYFVNRMKL